jgi:hypothetical protein
MIDHILIFVLVCVAVGVVTWYAQKIYRRLWPDGFFGDRFKGWCRN